MAIRVGINGFGRIGRQVLKIMKTKYKGKIDVVAFNDLGDLPTMTHLLKYDSVYGRYDARIEALEGAISVNGDKIRAFAEKDPSKIPWGDLGVDIVIESTGIFTDKESAGKHIQGGAKKVIISAPAKGEDLTIVMGVNEDLYDPINHTVVSNASCTTNCLAPAAKVVHDLFEIQSALMTTIHSYTNDQRILDLPHKDLRRARAAALSMIPTTTGAAKAVSLVIPDLKGKFDGFAMRVPTPTVSVVDFVAQVRKKPDADKLRKGFEKARRGRMKGILDVSEEPLVSADYRGSSFSSVVDWEFCYVMGNLVKIVTWYDNEWGYSTRCADLVKYMGDKL